MFYFTSGFHGHNQSILDFQGGTLQFLPNYLWEFTICIKSKRLQSFTHNSLFMLDGIIRSYMSITSLFSVIAFGSCFHEFSPTENMRCLQMCQWMTPHTLCLCVYSCSDFFFYIPIGGGSYFVSNLQNLHTIVRLTQSFHLLKAISFLYT